MSKIIIGIGVVAIIGVTAIISIFTNNENNLNTDNDTQYSENDEINNEENNMNENNIDRTEDENIYIEDSDVIENDFHIDVVLHNYNEEIHHSVYLPENINSKTESIPLYITLPGYEGLYFQGVGVNLRYENFASVAKSMYPNMIIVAPQLNDWGETSANQTIALIEYYKNHYNISKVYANGYSGGGETMSLVMGKRADLIDAYLHVSSQWDGGFESTVQNKTPVYIFIGEDDEYYGSSNAKNTYNTLYEMYKEEGLSDDEIDELLVLDLKTQDYFNSKGIPNQHGGGGFAAQEESVMNWLLTK